MNVVHHPGLLKYTRSLRQDLRSAFSRDLHKWLYIAPIMGAASGLLITLIAQVILKWTWPHVLAFYLAHKMLMVPGVAAGFVIAGLLMQYLTSNPDEHSTEEVINSYHHHQGRIEMRPFVPKLLAAVATVGAGGSAALEGPSVYGGGALGSWLWTKLRKLGLEQRDRRILLVSGAAAGMSAVFRAPLTGIIFALEMPYKDDLAHEALLPSLIASVTSYATMSAFLGAEPLFGFPSSEAYTRIDLFWSALLGLGCGLAMMAFGSIFRRVRSFSVKASLPHWLKMTIGGALTGMCGLAFLSIFPGNLIPLGPNYEAVSEILLRPHRSIELVLFGVFKLAATIVSLGFGGVSAMFVPLFLSGGSFGTAFSQFVVRGGSPGLYAAVGMAAFLAGGYKAPLTAVVFVAEATGGHGYIIPTLIGAAVAYAASGEGSVSSEQRVHETVRMEDFSRMTVREVMQKRVISVEAALNIREFAAEVSRHSHSAYPVYDGERLIGAIFVSSLAKVRPEDWERTTVKDMTERHVGCIPPELDLQEALRLLTVQDPQHMLLVTSPDGDLEGVVTKSAILSAINLRKTAPAKKRLPIR